jgi:hypothetical protein
MHFALLVALVLDIHEGKGRDWVEKRWAVRTVGRDLKSRPEPEAGMDRRQIRVFTYVQHEHVGIIFEGSLIGDQIPEHSLNHVIADNCHARDRPRGVTNVP